MRAGASIGGLARLGKVVQIAFIPHDWDASLAHWTQDMGAGPFFDLAHIPLVNTRYRGRPAGCDISAALGYWGDIQVELLRQHDDAPSIYREWTMSGQTGVHHLGIVVDDFDAALRLLKSAGGEAVQETEIPNAVRAAYVAMPDANTPLIEILSLQPEFLGLWAHMRSCAANWDGSGAPLRPVPTPDQW